MENDVGLDDVRVGHHRNGEPEEELRAVLSEDEDVGQRSRHVVVAVHVRDVDGVDDETWTHHLKRGDYSSWFRKCIKDEGLAAAVAEVEAKSGLTPAEARAAVRAEVEQRYTLPADAPSGIVADKHAQGDGKKT